jgi:hypothetical protein
MSSTPDLLKSLRNTTFGYLHNEITLLLPDFLTLLHNVLSLLMLNAIVKIDCIWAPALASPRLPRRQSQFLPDIARLLERRVRVGMTCRLRSRDIFSYCCAIVKAIFKRYLSACRSETDRYLRDRSAARGPTAALRRSTGSRWHAPTAAPPNGTTDCFRACAAVPTNPPRATIRKQPSDLTPRPEGTTAEAR